MDALSTLVFEKLAIVGVADSRRTRKMGSGVSGLSSSLYLSPFFPFLLRVSPFRRSGLQRILSTGTAAEVSATVRGVQQAATEIATRLSLESYYAILGGFFSYQMYNRKLPTI